MRKFVLFFLAVLSLVILGLATEAKSLEGNKQNEIDINQDYSPSDIE